MDNRFHPLVSIVIPVYNGANYLREAIESALAQTYDNIEIIVVNDGSEDGGATEKIAMSYGSRIRYFRKENGGVASALNLGIREMRGEYFSWLSHDDKYLPERIERQIEYLKKIGRTDVVLYGNFFFIDKNSRVTGRTRFKSIPPSAFREHLLLDYIANGCTMLIPRHCFGGDLFFREDLRITQDIDLWFRLAAHYDFILLEEPLTMYRISPFQESVRDIQHAFEKDLLYRRMLDTLFQEALDKEEKKGRERIRFLRFALGLFRMGQRKPSCYAFSLSRKISASSSFLSKIEECFLRFSYWRKIRKGEKQS